LRKSFKQSLPRAGKSFQPSDRRDWEIASGFGELEFYLLLALIAFALQAGDFPGHITMRKTAFDDFTDVSKASEGIKEIQKGGVSCAKLALERIRRSG